MAGQREHEPLLRSLVRTLPLPALLCSDRGEVIEVSESWNSLTGFSCHDTPTLASLANAAVVDPKLRKPFARFLTRTSVKDRKEKFSLRSREGKLLTLSFSHAALPKSVISGPWNIIHAESSPPSTTLMAPDIEFFNTSPLLMGTILIPKDDPVIESANPATARFFGTTIDRLMNRPFSSLNAPKNEVAHWVSTCELSRKSQSPQEIEFSVERADGTHWFNATLSFIGTTNLGVRRFSYAVKDFTERKRREDDLKFVDDVVSAVTRSLNFREAMEMFALSSLGRLGDGCAIDIVENGTVVRELIADTDRENQPHLESFRRKYPIRPDRPHPSFRVIQTGKSELFQEPPEGYWESLAYDDEHLQVLKGLGIMSTMVVPIHAQDKILGAVNFITKRGRRQFSEQDVELAELLAARAGLALENARLYTRAKEAVTLREEILGIVSHDLKNPLVSIRLNAELIERAIEAGKDLAVLKKSTVRIGHTVTQMKRLIDRLLDIGRIESGGLIMDRCPHGLKPILEQAVEMLRPIGLEKSIQIQVECVSDLIVYCDRDRVLQILSNLIGNAIKFSPVGRSVLVQATPEASDGAHILVRDTGCGISTENLGRIFERFWQAPETKRLGTGLGLHIAKGIVEAHGGRIWAESGPDGSTFHFTLPSSDKLPAAPVAV